MNIVEQNAEKLYGVVMARITEYLGGAAGEDYASWAEDVAQDTMLELWQRELDGKVPSIEVAMSNAKQIAWNRAHKFKAKETRRREIEQEHGESINRGLDGSREYTSADPFEIMAYEEMRSRLDELSPKLYNTVEAHYIDGLSVQECAEKFECSEDVIYKRLQRARDVVSGED